MAGQKGGYFPAFSGISSDAEAIDKVTDKRKCDYEMGKKQTAELVEYGG